MDKSNFYIVAGKNLTSFVEEWVQVLESGGGQSRGLLEHAVKDSDYSYGGIFMMANIGSRATAPDASDEELLLFAVLSVFQLSDFPGTNSEQWEGEKSHLRYAFNYFKELGEKEAARRLRADVLRRSLREEPPAWKALKQSQSSDPAKESLHDQDMASIDERSFRAAQLLDPDGDFDSELRAFSL